VERSTFCFKQAFSSELKTYMYLSKGKHLYQNVEHLAHYFPWTIKLYFERNTSWNLGFSRWREVHFARNRSIQMSWRNTCISGKKTNCVRSRST
jgi:hypothetical protein